MELSFTGKIRLAGKSYVVTIPFDYVSNDLIRSGIPYKFSVKDVKDKEVLQ